MTKRTGHIETGDELEELNQPRGPRGVIVIKNDPYDPRPFVFPSMIDAAMQRLIDSNIVTATDSAISWREGHLEHVARLYVSDPAQTWRDYADDLTVALAADGSAFAALVERARGE